MDTESPQARLSYQMPGKCWDLHCVPGPSCWVRFVLTKMQGYVAGSCYVPAAG